MLLYVIYAYFNKMSRIADIILFIYKIPELIQFHRSDFYKNLFEVSEKKIIVRIYQILELNSSILRAHIML